jgi:Asp-tRNA(Asn)/Glu-tRNA(Gln) amidotransferase A subunit family amidase
VGAVMSSAGDVPADAGVEAMEGWLPVGMQVVGPGYGDDTAITFAEPAGDIIGGYEQPPIRTGAAMAREQWH